MIKQTAISLRKKLIFSYRKILGHIRFDKKRKRIVLHERYEKVVKYSLRSLMIIGIILSLVSMPIFIGFTIAIASFILEQLLEKILFMFNTLYIQPIPTPEQLKKANWRANLFGFAMGDIKNKDFLIGLVFENKTYGKEVFDIISAWNNKEVVDFNNNVNLSFIIENDNDYSTYIYPSNNREQIKKARKYRKAGKINNQMIFTIIMCKVFPYNATSSFKAFSQNYSNGDIYTLGAFYIEGKAIKPIEGTIKIKKKHLKIMKRRDLTQKDLEFEHGLFVKDR